MISRYSRRAVKQNLHIGVSHTALHQHPPPEEAETDCTPQSKALQQDASACNRSVCPSAVAVETSRAWSQIDSYTGTGVSTERSSVFSWAYDEFDKAASRQVQLLFEEIDEELYEGRGGVQQDECKLWTSRFPHLRILGKQLVCTTDEGFQWFSVSSHNSSSGTHIQSTGNELCVQGHRAALCMEVTHKPDSCDSHEDELNKGIEEEEGLMEEYLVFDWRDIDEECVCVNRRTHLVPPVSPYRCRREAVLDFLFDDVWQELIGCMEELLMRLWEGCSSDEEKSSVSLSPAHHQSHNPSGMKSSTSGTLPRLGPQPQHTPNALHTPSTKSRGSKSRWKSKKQRKPSTPSRVCSGSAALQHHTLNELIVVHSLPLQQRHTTAPEHTAHDSEERMSLSKPRPRCSLEQSPSPLPRPPPSSRRRPLPPRTLLPLTQSSTSGNMEDIIRGTRLAPAGERLSSSVMTLSRNTLLPPIGTADKEHTHSGHHTHLSQRHRAPSSRAHSAVADEAGSLLAFSRPNTTHTFRSDTPHRRSFTVLDSSRPARPGRASMGTDSLGIGVTGISLGISSSSFLDSFATHTLDHSPIEDGEEPEGRAPPPALLVPVSLQSHSRGGLMTRSNRPGP
ncbi:protein FAM149B1 isoform X2 [Ictalurus punctatus]|uniref:Protein FAM149B1 isoform X2 n=1 Tax=Ictalurus punctatus TaxID=7998 RepID=A0A9F7RNB9_ICTPU|nr:protein FAM149B1 isoform X2 [Ictalurus punctatus]